MPQDWRCRCRCCPSASFPPIGDGRACGAAEMRYSGGPNVPQYSTASVQKVRLGGSTPMQSPTRGRRTVAISSRKWRALRGRGQRRGWGRGRGGVLGDGGAEKGAGRSGMRAEQGLAGPAGRSQGGEFVEQDSPSQLLGGLRGLLVPVASLSTFCMARGPPPALASRSCLHAGKAHTGILAYSGCLATALRECAPWLGSPRGSNG